MTTALVPADPSTTTTLVPADLSTTTTPVATDPTTTLPPVPTSAPPPVDDAPIGAVDVAGQTVFDVRIFDAVDVDAVVAQVSGRLGSPAFDGGWQPTPAEVDCAGSTEFRVLWWGDFRMTFERYEGEGEVRDELSAWTVGDPTAVELAPLVVVPPSSPSHVVTLEGVGLGSTRADLDAAWPNLHSSGDGRLVAVDRGGTLTVALDAGGQVVGFGNGPFDCPTDEIR